MTARHLPVVYFILIQVFAISCGLDITIDLAHAGHSGVHCPPPGLEYEKCLVVVGQNKPISCSGPNDPPCHDGLQCCNSTIPTCGTNGNICVEPHDSHGVRTRFTNYYYIFLMSFFQYFAANTDLVQPQAYRK